MQKSITAHLALALSMALTLSGCNNKQETAMTQDPLDGPVVEMTTSKGIMKIKLYNATPHHRDNFLKLVNEKFYDGVKFHRVIEDFMIQGGDPLSKDDSLVTSWGTGGPGYTVPAEFVDTLRHRKGALAAARQGDMANPRRASSGSQFYIVQSENGCSHLDGQYTVYGQVIEGLEVIDAIAAVDTDPYDRPIVPVIIDSVRLMVPADSLSTVAAPSDSLSAVAASSAASSAAASSAAASSAAASSAASSSAASGSLSSDAAVDGRSAADGLSSAASSAASGSLSSDAAVDGRSAAAGLSSAASSAASGSLSSDAAVDGRSAAAGNLSSVAASSAASGSFSSDAAVDGRSAAAGNRAKMPADVKK